MMKKLNKIIIPFFLINSLFLPRKIQSQNPCSINYQEIFIQNNFWRKKETTINNYISFEESIIYPSYEINKRNLDFYIDYLPPSKIRGNLIISPNSRCNLNLSGQINIERGIENRDISLEGLLVFYFR
jgi:hypothetical protein